ncbi:unnamed protein product, partial [Staurois parvus]
VQHTDTVSYVYSASPVPLTTSLPGTYTPFLPRPIESFQRCRTLSDNYAVMQHCTHMKFLSFFVTDRALFWWYLITSGFFIFS